jgi:WD40 repeat protein
MDCLQSGDMLVTISKDATARSWNLITRQPGLVFAAHTGQLWCAWLAKEGSTLLTGSEDCTARLWDTATGRNTLILAHKRPVTFVLASEARRRALTCCDCSSAWLWNLEDGMCANVLRVRSCSFRFVL